MSVKYSTAIRNGLAAIGSMKSMLDGLRINIYSGTEPPTADDAGSGDAVLLLTIDNGGVGITWEGAAGGMLRKSADETWAGTIVANGTATWFRIQTSADDGSQSQALYRVQGSVGTLGADINLTSGVDLESGVTLTLNTFYLVFLAGVSS